MQGTLAGDLTTDQEEDDEDIITEELAHDTILSHAENEPFFGVPEP